MAVTSTLSIDETQRVVSGQLNPTRRSALGQFMTPSAIANFMASLFKKWPSHIDLLDPGAGVGSLTEAFVTRLLAEAPYDTRLNISAYEIDPLLGCYFDDHFSTLDLRGQTTNRAIKVTKLNRDFIVEGVFALSFAGKRYSHAILNPPYKKIAADSEYRKLLRKVGVETVNLYTAFLALSIELTKEDGEIVAIVPRSFCNGTYFRPFRKWLLDRVAISHIHVFESRKKAFSDDDVLQENVIVHFVRAGAQGSVTISTSHDSTFSDYAERVVPFSEIVKPSDQERFIHIPTIEATDVTGLFCHSLAELGLNVATGPVVDFRLRQHLLAKPSKDSAPLLYAHHFVEGKLNWPREHRKPNAITICDESRKWLMPKGWYAVTKRFSSKEERRRIVSYVVDPGKLPNELYGFENHLNVIHSGKRGLSPDLARGLSVFLNSTIVDQHFRTFSGHTQVNATDLRAMHFPSKDTLIEFGKWAHREKKLTQEKIDALMQFHHAD